MNKKDWEGYIYGLDVAPTGTKLVNFKAVALCMAYHSDWRSLEGMSASMTTIAKETGIGRTTVIKIVAEMLKLGFLVKREEKRVWTKNIWTHIYDLTIPSQEVQLSEHPEPGDANQEVQLSEHPRLIAKGQEVQLSEHPESGDANQEVQNEGQEVQNEGQEVQNQGQEVQLSEHNHTNNHTKDHTYNHTAQDGDENRGCDGNEPTGTQTASQQLSDSTKEDAHSPDSSEATARAGAAPTSHEATRDETEQQDNATASLDLKTNAADSKTSSADSWQEMVDEKAREERLKYCPVCNEPFAKTDKEKWCRQTDCLRRIQDEDGHYRARTYKIDELVEPKTADEAAQIFEMKRRASESWL